jgi:NAD-dependent dihydropyrimidine dehydrogenase PreA subunit
MSVNNRKCIECNKCVNICKMDIEKVGDRECLACTECINICPEKVIKFGRKF